MGLDTSLIITSWNSQPFLDNCLASLKEIGYEGELIVVEEPRNWSVAVNKGIKQASNQIVIISNPDIVFNRTLYRLIREFRQRMMREGNPYLVVCPALVHPNGRLQCYKKMPRLIDLFITETRLGKWFDAALGKPIWRQREQLKRTGQLAYDELPTASLFITTKDLLEWFKLDERMMRAEDWDLWKRLSLQRIKTFWTDESAFVHHIGHAGTNRTHRTQRRIELQGVLYYADKWNIHPYLLRFFLALERITEQIWRLD